MNRFDFPKELVRAVVVAVVAFVAGLVLKAMGTGRWFAAAASGALAGLVALATMGE